MPVVVAVSCGLAAVIVGLLVSAALGSRLDAPASDARTDRFLVDWLSSHSGGRRLVTALDHHVWGGAMVGLALAVTTAFGAATGLLLVSVRTDTGFARADRAAARWGSEHSAEATTEILLWLTDLGGTSILATAMVIVGLIELARTRHAIPLTYLVVVVAGVSFVNGLLKQLIDRERPEAFALVPVGESASFPSGHSASAAACWAALAIVASRTWRFGERRWALSIGAGFAVLVAATRVMLGVHWTSDVLAGLAVGWTWCFLVTLAFGSRLHAFGDPARRAADRARQTPPPSGQEPVWSSASRRRGVVAEHRSVESPESVATPATLLSRTSLSR